MHFSSKAQTLKNLSKKGFNVPKLIIYKVKNYIKNKNIIIKNIQSNFKDKIAIRSSSAKEDLLGMTNAGKYKSFLNVEVSNHEKIKYSIDQIIKDYEYDEKNEFFVQEMVKNVKISGVCTTRDIHTKLPYTVINFSTGEDTTLVTSGKKNTKTTSYIENNLFKFNNYENRKIYETSKKLIKRFNNDSLDIEFAITKSKKIFILQVRPIYLQNVSKLLSKKELILILSKLKKKSLSLRINNIIYLGKQHFLVLCPTGIQLKLLE